ncbi:hypothetical protein KUV64_13945 [Mameliella alba]|uniref:hypothetical protein n=1 Tax=Mameliella TaxID=1434019 RepID=UPI001C98B662|nr:MULTISPECIES: hypothetical protein [Mameliella]MBY6120235.1 hypothetical protein [Mameliella alba]MDD9733130.1 hypothetical protein [Mameliella sp. AT18]
MLIPTDPMIPAQPYCGLPVRIEHPDPAAVFDLRDMRPRADFDSGAMGLPRIRNGFTVQWCPRLRCAVADQFHH